MANILIIYGTTEGHTRKVALQVGGYVRDRGHDAEVVDCSALRDDLTLRVYDAFIVLGSIHQGHHQRPLVHFVNKHQEELQKVPSAFMSISLTAAYRDGNHEAELNKCANMFFEQTGWHPTVWTPVAGALKYVEYDWFKRMILRSISEKAGGDTDTTRDWEYTDWEKLEAFVDRFVHEHVPGKIVEEVQ